MMSSAATTFFKPNSKQAESVPDDMKDTLAKTQGRKVAVTNFTALNLNGPIDCTPNDPVITQFKCCCAAGNLCKHKDIPVNRIHQCAACGFGVHAMCEVELKASKSKNVPSTSIKGVCRACLD
jgi:hypothetical protein